MTDFRIIHNDEMQQGPFLVFIKRGELLAIDPYGDGDFGTPRHIGDGVDLDEWLSRHITPMGWKTERPVLALGEYHPRIYRDAGIKAKEAAQVGLYRWSQQVHDAFVSA